MAKQIINITKNRGEVIDESIGMIPAASLTDGDSLTFNLPAKKILAAFIYSSNGDSQEWVGSFDPSSIAFSTYAEEDLYYHFVYIRGSSGIGAANQVAISLNLTPTTAITTEDNVVLTTEGGIVITREDA